MIEKIIIDYLTAKGLSVYAEEPLDEAAPYFVIQKTSGGEEEHVRRASVAVQSYGASMFGAATANEDVIALMLGMVELDSIASITLNSDYNYTDTATKRYRYQAVFDIYYYD